MEWITYLLKVSVCMALFYTCYHFFLQRLTFFSANRIYLLATLLISFSIPALQLEIEKNREVSVVEVFQNSPIVDGATGIPIHPAENAQMVPILQPASDFSWQQMLWYTYLAVALIVIMVFVVQMFMLLRHTKRVDTKFGRLKVVYKPTGFTNCSFLNYVFVDREAFTESEIDILLQHENVHASKYHSADRLLITLAKIVLWFNPLIYLYDKALEQIHEYQADKEAALTIGPSSYAELLLNVSVKNNGNPLVHNFVKNPLKERIKMLFSTQSRNMKKLVYLSCLPLLAILLWSFSVSYVYKEPPFEVATESSKDNLAFQSDTPKYRQKVIKLLMRLMRPLYTYMKKRLRG
ncbi:MAG: hypothetical protein EOO88_51470 [Pedobacter sp.]|nr:MAG: hypothetical protein EOO88_51470 [Pedobacter sp.]